eukprot:jgi/Bigna1/141437/aug1.62_g16145
MRVKRLCFQMGAGVLEKLAEEECILLVVIDVEGLFKRLGKLFAVGTRKPYFVLALVAPKPVDPKRDWAT